MLLVIQLLYRLTKVGLFFISLPVLTVVETDVYSVFVIVSLVVSVFSGALVSYFIGKGLLSLNYFCLSIVPLFFLFVCLFSIFIVSGSYSLLFLALLSFSSLDSMLINSMYIRKWARYFYVAIMLLNAVWWLLDKDFLSFLFFEAFLRGGGVLIAFLFLFKRFESENGLLLSYYREYCDLLERYKWGYLVNATIGMSKFRLLEAYFSYRYGGLGGMVIRGGEFAYSLAGIIANYFFPRIKDFSSFLNFNNGILILGMSFFFVALIIPTFLSFNWPMISGLSSLIILVAFGLFGVVFLLTNMRYKVNLICRNFYNSIVIHLSEGLVVFGVSLIILLSAEEHFYLFWILSFLSFLVFYSRMTNSFARIEQDLSSQLKELKR